MKPLSLIANEVNERLETLKKTVYSKQNIPEPKKPDAKDTKLSGGAKKMTLDNLSSDHFKVLEILVIAILELYLYRLIMMKICI